jgi:hypothetical protein
MNYGKEFKSLLQAPGINAMYIKIVAAIDPTKYDTLYY